MSQLFLRRVEIVTLPNGGSRNVSATICLLAKDGEFNEILQGVNLEDVPLSEGRVEEFIATYPKKLNPADWGNLFFGRESNQTTKKEEISIKHVSFDSVGCARILPQELKDHRNWWRRTHELPIVIFGSHEEIEEFPLSKISNKDLFYPGPY